MGRSRGESWEHLQYNLGCLALKSTKVSSKLLLEGFTNREKSHLQNPTRRLLTIARRPNSRARSPWSRGAVAPSIWAWVMGLTRLLLFTTDLSPLTLLH